MSKNAKSCDVAIIGGGLAGLTLALQLRRTHDDLDIVVLERNSHPVPLAAHKVGESTVELGARYLTHHVGLTDHLEQDHLRKNGLRFFFGDGRESIDQADELGTSKILATPSYQVDRGLLENELGRRARDTGIRFQDDTRVTGVNLDGAREVHFESGSGSGTVSARWLVDAASRASPLKRHLGLRKANDHDVNAAWFRVEGEVRIDDWSKDTAWQARNPGAQRWLSTNHFMGPGYWVWLIPLGSGHTSVGIVADPALHPLETYNTLDAATAWLRQHQPGCANALENREILDFAFLRHFSHDSKKLFSRERWALTGEAGVFLDPFYSPGTDFIAISNSFVADLISRDRAGRDIGLRSVLLEDLYRSFYANTLALYQDLYPGFGDQFLMVLKTTWDYCYYWGVLALLFYNDALDEPLENTALRRLLGTAVTGNSEIQARFRQRAARRLCEPGQGRFYDQYAMPIMRRLNQELLEPVSGPALVERIADNVASLAELQKCFELRLDDPGRAAGAWEREALGDLGKRLSS